MKKFALYLKSLVALVLFSLLSINAQPLIDTLVQGDLREFRSKLALTADVNATNAHGFTPLMIATRDHSLREMKLLLDRVERRGIQQLAQLGVAK